MAKTKTKKVVVPLYQHNITIIQTEFFDDIIREHKLELVRAEFGAFCFINNSADIFMVFNYEDVSIPLIAHESLHCVDYIFTDIGYYPEHGNKEPETHLLAWIVDECIDFLKL